MKKSHSAGTEWTQASLNRSKASSQAASQKNLGGKRVGGSTAPSSNKGAKIKGR